MAELQLVLDNMWDIVFWKDDNSVNFVPSCWGNPINTLYKFPTSKNEKLVRKLIHDCEDLEHDYEWHAAEAKKVGIPTLKDAQELCKKGQYTSAIESDDNTIQQKTRSGRIHKKKMYESDSESSTTSFQGVQSIQKKNYSTSKNLVSSKDCSSKFSDNMIIENEFFDDVRNTNSDTVRTRYLSDLTNLNDDRRDNPKSNEELLRKDIRSASSRVYRRGVQNVRSDSIGRSLRPDDSRVYAQHLSEQFDVLNNTSNIGSIMRPVSTSGNLKMGSERLLLTRTRSRSLDRNGPEHDGNPLDGSLTVLRQVTELKFEVNKMSLQIDRIEKLLSNFMTENVLGEGDNDGDFLNNIPLGSVDAINSFDYEIKSDKKKFKKLVHLLYLLGGDTTQKIVYSHMNKLITNEAGVLYSGQGKKKKLPFMNLTLYNVILVATRKRLPTATEVDIKKSVALFLATAKSRIKPFGTEKDDDIQ
ncbi:hypothetical protein RN001_013645 [Aquatica leii]|uniref:DUF4806 domain-containing protein n=1 Tax=Aquatica leii TaxID=1421715 RepID=A0AAN7NWJ5_9COLE|nr:hypothetical protein RN001_013645 [Aquatica leii]